MCTDENIPTSLYCENCGAFDGETQGNRMERYGHSLNPESSKDFVEKLTAMRYSVTYTNKHMYLCQYCAKMAHPTFSFHYQTGKIPQQHIRRS